MKIGRKMWHLVPRDCRCGARPGELHQTGCDKERCAICGGQLISCDCVYAVSGIDVATLDQTHPDVFEHGPTEEMWRAYDARVASLGGPLPWSGEYPGSEECRRFGFWCRMVPGRGWTSCDPSHPEATENVSRLHVEAKWNPLLRRWELKDPSSRPS